MYIVSWGINPAEGAMHAVDDLPDVRRLGSGGS